MARPISVTQTGAGTSRLVPGNYQITPFNATIVCTVTGTVNYTVQYTVSDTGSSTYVQASDTNWTNHATLASQTATAAGTQGFPVSGFQLVVNSGSGSVTMTVLQAGTNN